MSGRELPIPEPTDRNDSVGVCFWEMMDLPELVVIEVTGDLTYQNEIRREHSMALVISAISERNTVYAAFENEANLLYD